LTAAGLDPSAISLNSMIDSAGTAATTVTGPMRDAMAMAIEGIFVLAFIAAGLGLIATAFAPATHARGVVEGEEADAGMTEFVPEL
jgi:hypothetical protein